MKIADIFKKRMSFSFEVFPPKPDKPIEPLLKTLGSLYKFEPDFISITCGSGGTNRERNIEVCEHIIGDGQTAMAHLTCIGDRTDAIDGVLRRYREIGVKNLLTLRGDYPAGWTGENGDFEHAIDLVRHVRKTAPDFCIDAACCPEKHIEASTLDVDIMHLRSKVEAGADFLTTQLFYDNDAFFRYRDKLNRAKIRVPVVVGVMPLLNSALVIRLTTMNGVSIPKEVSALIAKYGDKPEEFKKAGIEYSIEQIATLVVGGIDGLHLYSMNRCEEVSEIIMGSGLRKYIAPKDACEEN